MSPDYADQQVIDRMTEPVSFTQLPGGGNQPDPLTPDEQDRVRQASKLAGDSGDQESAARILALLSDPAEAREMMRDDSDE